MQIKFTNVRIKKDLLAKARAGDISARAELRANLDGMILYHDIFDCADDEDIVDVEDLYYMNIINSVQIRTKHL